VKIRGLLTKTEWGLLVLSALFLCLMFVVVYHTMPPGQSTGYTITTRIPAGDVTPEEVPPININTASVNELEALDGIGPVLAERIVAYREEHGPFAAIEDLMQVKGIGEDSWNNLLERITIEEEP
jgi:competence protein ComEA